MTSTRSAAPAIPQQKAWAKAIAQPAPEFPLTPLPILSGKIPAGLRGSLYRNGPGRLERNGVRVNHWFDGDGSILGVHFTEAGATGVYRYVQSVGYQDEAAAGQFLYSGYGTLAPGPIWERWTKQLKNAANTSVLPLSDKVLALWEAGQPHALDPQTLETQGLEDFGSLTPNCPYSAHPKQDSATGEIFNFGLVAGANATLNLYRSDANGRLLQKTDIPLNGIPLIHDFALAGPYLVFCVPPLRLNAFPAVLGLSSFSDALQWRPKYGSQIIVIDRNTLEPISWGETDPWFQWHFGNCYQDFDGDVVLNLVSYQNFQTNQRLKEVAAGHLQTEAPSQLRQIRLRPQTAKITHQEILVDQDCDFPIVSTQVSDPDIARTYLSVHRPGADTREEMFGAIACYNPATQSLTLADAGPHRYPAEPTYAADAMNPQQGWILTVVFDGNTDSSEVWIYDCDRLEDEPVCRLGLPSIIPHSFHGAWKSA
ncbi:MAG: carotenoid oxygenase family protein [Leptolyngbyaceae cyanobacterium MO_188.B28]|nr:carotenoid oxygenase family protein [Leptolyngbyaceae cyanobacterium MO_188.B28]